MRLGVLITTYNRPKYLQRTLFHVKRAKWDSGTVFCIVDDKSTDSETIALIRQFEMEGFEVKKLSNEKNSSVSFSLKRGIETLFDAGCEVVTNLDSDAIIRNDFADVMLSLYKTRHKPLSIVSGFNSRNKQRNGVDRHPVVSVHEGYELKRTVGGINMLFDLDTYQTYIDPVLTDVITNGGNWDHKVCLKALENEDYITVAVPSVVDHIGFDSSMKHTEEPDVACDFKSLYLPNVTLCFIEGVNIERMKTPVRNSLKDIQFGREVYLSSLKSNWTTPIRSLPTRAEYSKFCMKELYNYIETDYVLIIQHDGYVVDWTGWDDINFQYDYIGAPWWYSDGMNVGNGGFSLRSRKLLKALAEDETISKYEPEDHHICRTYRRKLEKEHGIVFAPEDVARKFSIEGWPGRKAIPHKGQFGFHGNLVTFSGRTANKLIINQFRGLGDILFCIPLVREWINRGYSVTWPVESDYLNIQKHFPEITFVEKGKQKINYGSMKFETFKDSLVVPLLHANSILNVPYKDCMKSKYMLFGGDWNTWRSVSWQRDTDRENKLFYEVLGLKDGERYNLVNHKFRTDRSGKNQFTPPDGEKNVELQFMREYTLMDWGKVIEQAEKIYTVGTSINYVIEALDCKASEINLYVRRPEEKDFSYYDYILSDKYNYILHP